MSGALDSLLTALDLEEIAPDLHRSAPASEAGERERVYGGHVVAQALMAAGRTAPGFRAHSLHAYFLRASNPALPIDYAVDRLRAGRSFVTRRVLASQGGEPILDLSTSFHVSEDGFVHQIPMPRVPPPDRCPALTRERPIELRPVDAVDGTGSKPLAMEQGYWMRANGRMPDDPSLHQCVAAYASDSTLIDAILRPHQKNFFSPDVASASLDHAVWLHRPFRMDQWILFHQATPSAFGARGLALGHCFTEDGTLVASVAQEGLIRQRVR
jgi:acyl-CoA thioesterase-2